MGLQEGHALVIVREGDVLILQPITNTLLDMRGSVEVTDHQDFEAIRKKVTMARAKVADSDSV